MVLASRGDAAKAARLISRAEQVWTDIRATPESWITREHDRTIELVCAQLDAADLEREMAEGRRLTLDDAFALAVGPPR